MPPPSVSCLCMTYGRFELLEEAVECFLRQDYPGDMELIVLNDLVDQRIVFDHPKVRVVNLKTRCNSLGHKRNIITSYATKDLLATWGDDDIHLPWRISRLVRAHLISKAPAVLDGFHYILHHGKIRLNTDSTSGSLLVHRLHLLDAGGIPEMNCGEDSALLERLRARGEIAKSEEKPPGFLYRWDSPRRHISQLGLDRPGLTTSWDRYEVFVKKLIAQGLEPSGVLQLSPRWRHDYVNAVERGSLQGDP